MLSNKVLNSIELNKVLLKIKNYLVLEKSEDILLSQNFAQNFEEMKSKLNFTKEADIVICQYNVDPLYSFDNVDNILIKAEKQITLTISEILKVQKLFRSSRLFKTKINQIDDNNIIVLKEFADIIFTNKAFEKECDRCFISDEQISDNASNTLQSIRKSIKKINDQIKEKLNSVLRYGNNAKYIQDYYVTIRNGRYVIPVKAEFKNSISGMLHDRSASGSTVFIEPDAVVQLNNELKLFKIKENEEIEKILQKFTADISISTENLKNNSDILIKADIAFAKAKYSHSIKAIYPMINSNGYINIINGRHPLIDKDQIIPVSLSLGKDYKYLIITGPNTGGKTVTLKLCGLFTAMAMCGIFLPCSDGSEISFFDSIFTDIGDEQSIEQNLSTFSSHMKNIINICNNINGKSLVLIDEIGAGTDPAEGAALALAILNHLLKNSSFGIITTHYNELKEFAFLQNDAKNASMEFDPVKLNPTYKLIIGIPGSSNALEISKKLGLNEEIISSAYKNLTNEKIMFEKVLKSAEKARAEAEINLDKTEKAKKEYYDKLEEIKFKEKKLKQTEETATENAKAKAKRIYTDAVTKSEELLKELKDIIKSEEIKEYDIIKSRQIKKHLENNKYSYENFDKENIQNLKPVDKLKKGQTVYIKSLSTICTVLDISKNNVRVKAGGLDVNTKKSDLFLIENKDNTVIKKDKVNKNNNKSSINIIKNIETVTAKTEIKLLGKTVLDALPEIDSFLDNCSINGIKECKIIHGLGTGALKKGIWEHLKTQPLVDSYRSGKYGEGESGVTIIILK